MTAETFERLMASADYPAAAAAQAVQEAKARRLLDAMVRLGYVKPPA